MTSTMLKFHFTSGSRLLRSKYMPLLTIELPMYTKRNAALFLAFAILNLPSLVHPYYMITRYNPADYTLRVEPYVYDVTLSHDNPSLLVLEDGDNVVSLSAPKYAKRNDVASRRYSSQPGYEYGGTTALMRGDVLSGITATRQFQKNRKDILIVPPNTLSKHKRSAENAKPLPETEHVCEMTIRNDYQPKFGHEQNGTRVEIQQDGWRQFRATFVECVSTKRDSCHGIDDLLFTSECVTIYEFRPAGIRLENSGTDFLEGFVKVPIACQCRLRRKVNRILIE